MTLHPPNSLRQVGKTSPMLASGSINKIDFLDINTASKQYKVVWSLTPEPDRTLLVLIE